MKQSSQRHIESTNLPSFQSKTASSVNEPIEIDSDEDEEPVSSRHHRDKHSEHTGRNKVGRSFVINATLSNRTDL